MKTTKFLTAALLAAALAGCSQEEQFDMLQEAQKEFTGSFEQVASRVTMDSDYMMNWEATTDYVSIFPGITVNNSYQVSSVTDGKATFKFVDYVDPTDGYSKTTGNYNYAVYPYADANSITADGTITASVPASFDYDGMENSIQTALMVAKSSNGSLSFKNAQGILRLRLNAQQPLNYGAVKSIQIASAANPLSGAVTITFGEDGLPAATLASEGGKTLTLNLAEALQTTLPKAANSEYAEFYIPIVPTAFAENDVTMTITWADTEKTAYEKVVTIPFSIERRKIFTLYHTIGATEMDGELEGAEEVWDGVTATTPEVVTDEETGETYYAVGSGSDLAGLAALVNGTSTATYARSATTYNFKLTADIDLGGYQWTPIGNADNVYTGTFDGQGHTIQNLSIVETEAVEGKAYVGFFGYATGATIKNVTFENVNLNIACLDIDHSQGHIGAVAGSLEGTSTIENVTVKGDVKVEATVAANGASRVAVVAGGNEGSDNVTMKNVHVIAKEGSYLKANNNVGALAGQLQGKNVFENCTSNIDVTGTKFFAGGIIGLAAGNSTFTNCHTTGDVTITAGRSGKANDHYRVGGIAGGWADNTSTPCVLTNCSYTGTISGTNADGSVAETLDYAGYVGRGYTLTNKAGSTVTIDGVSYIQAHNTIFGKYIVVKNGVYEVDNATELVNVWNFIEDGATVKLMDNITFDEDNRTNSSGTWYEGIYYQGDKSFTIDLNEKAITNENEAINDYMVFFHNNGTKANTITIKNGKIDAGTKAYSAVATAKSNASTLTINLENVELINNISGATVKARGGSVLNVKAGTKITGEDSYTCLEAVGSATVVNIYDGTEFYQNGTTHLGSLVGTSYGATVNVYGGKGVSKKSALFVYSSGGTLNAMGGEWTGNSDGTVPTPEGDNNSNVLVVQNNTYESGYVGASIMNVTGGTYKGGVSACGYTDTSDAQLHIKGGTFNTDPTSYLADGYKIKDGTTYEVVMNPAAKVGDTEYATLNEAIKAGGDITLLRDVTINGSQKISTKVSIDLNSYTIKRTDVSASSQCYVFLVKTSGEVTFKGKGEVCAAGAAKYAYPIWIYGGKVNIEGGTYTHVGLTDNGSELIYVQIGELNISGGTFIPSNKITGKDYYWAVNCNDTNYKSGTAKVSITGGTFENFDPSNNAAEGAGTNFVVEGYKATESNGTWTVTANE